MTHYSPFQLTDVPNGWVVSWPDYVTAVAKNERQIHNLLKILFDEIGVWQAHLGVMPDNGETETYSVDSMAWHQEDSGKYLAEHIASRYVVSGVYFQAEHEDHARQFLEHLEKRYIWLKLGGGHWT